MKQKAVLIASVIVGLLAFWMTHQYLQGEREQLFKDAEEVEVLAAAHDLTAGTVLTDKDLGITRIFRRKGGLIDDYVLPKDLDKIMRRKIRWPVDQRKALTWSNVEMPQVARGLAPIIKPPLRAVSIAVGGEAAVSGLVQPNDHVDILGTFSFPSRSGGKEMENVTLTLLQNVTVLATGQRLGKQEFEEGDRVLRGGAYSTVTFEVTPREAELLVFAQTVQGRLTLTLRHPEDMSFEKNLPEVNFQHIEKNLPELNAYRQDTILHKN